VLHDVPVVYSATNLFDANMCRITTMAGAGPDCVIDMMKKGTGTLLLAGSTVRIITRHPDKDNFHVHATILTFGPTSRPKKTTAVWIPDEELSMMEVH
jgi:hypothetical protein